MESHEASLLPCVLILRYFAFKVVSHTAQLEEKTTAEALLEEKLLERRLRAHDSHTSVSSALAPRVARSAGCGSGGGRGLARGGGLVEERERRPAQQQAHRREALLLAACDDTASR